MAGLGPNQVRVIVRGAGKNGRSLRYVRNFAGFTVSQAIGILSRWEHPQGLPIDVVTISPYYVNGEEVQEYSEQVLQGGDVLSADDP